MSARPQRILISACLFGQPVRYDGAAKPIGDARIDQWQREGRLVVICPELAGGLAVPRPAAERRGDQVIDGRGNDVTAAFRAGAQAALDLALAQGCGFALLKEDSPSCGSNRIHDGSFTGRRIAGMGLTAALLRANGIQVFSEYQVDALALALAETAA